MSQYASLRKRSTTMAGRSMKTYGTTTLLGVALASLAFALILVLTIGVLDVQANPVTRRSPNAHGGGGMLQQSAGDFNNLDDLINEFVDDRRKKSKQNSVRQIKQTLRFGRRSDPLMMPVSELERDQGDLSDRFGERPAYSVNED